MSDRTVDHSSSTEADSPAASQLSLISESSSIPEINMSSDVPVPGNGNPSDASVICDNAAIDSLAVSNPSSDASLICDNGYIDWLAVSRIVKADSNDNPSDASVICDNTDIDWLAVSNLASMDDTAPAEAPQVAEPTNPATEEPTNPATEEPTNADTKEPTNAGDSSDQAKLDEPVTDDGAIHLKVICLGDSAVGKSKLVERFLLAGFKQQSLSTYAVTTFQHKTIVDGEAVVVDIWDTAGQEKFNNLHASYYHDAHACIMVFDCTRKITYKNLIWWYKELKQYRPEIPCLCAVNKIDANPTATKRSFLIPQKMNVPLYYVSASDGTNVVKLFNDAIKSALEYKKNPTDFVDQIMKELEAVELTVDEPSEKSKDLPVDGQDEASVDKSDEKPAVSPKVKDPSDETAKDPSDDTAKDPSDDTAKDPSDDTAKDPSDDTATDNSDETAKDPSDETTKCPDLNDKTAPDPNYLIQKYLSGLSYKIPSDKDPANKPVEKVNIESPNKESSDESGNSTGKQNQKSSLNESFEKAEDISEKGCHETSFTDSLNKSSDSSKEGSQKSPAMLICDNP